MINVTCLTTPTSVLPSYNQQNGTYRNVYLTNNSTTESIWLLFDGTNQAGSAALSQTALSATVPAGYQLAKGTSFSLITNSPGGRDGCNPIYAVSVSGAALLSVQVTIGAKTLP